MALTNAENETSYYPSANFLDNVSALSFSVWVKPTTIYEWQQYVISHYGSTNRFVFYKKYGTGSYWRFAVTSGGYQVYADDSTDAVAVDTVYHIAGTWELNVAGGIKIYRNGSLVDSNDTTSQSVNYSSGGGVSLSLMAQKDSAALDLPGDYEGVAIWGGVALSAQQIKALYWSGWPHLAGCPRPSVFYRLSRDYSGRIPDWSGNGRHIESAYCGASNVGAADIGKWEQPHFPISDQGLQGAAGPAPPNPWTLWDTITHPTLTDTVTGLSNGTAYEFSLTALDDSDNESTRSATVEATPSGTATVHTEALKLLFTH